ncbi:DUF2325 domain-containing protein [Sulfurimonas sp.]|uniref:DUF2325 domain-containing protein n=1 Tax=Sulfurimonas sp. TaxID=2022749 RepID=UPI002B47C613|nr:DUF2325 domain-containing protein [Sulfurimonas sp.]
MSILLIGGDKVTNITDLLKSLGATKTTHWDSRKNSTSHKKIPANTDAIIMLTDFLKHNSMSHFKKSAKKQDIPLICTRRGTASVAAEFNKFLETRKCLS